MTVAYILCRDVVLLDDVASALHRYGDAHFVGPLSSDRAQPTEPRRVFFAAEGDTTLGVRAVMGMGDEVRYVTVTSLDQDARGAALRIHLLSQLPHWTREQFLNRAEAIEEPIGVAVVAAGPRDLDAADLLRRSLLHPSPMVRRSAIEAVTMLNPLGAGAMLRGAASQERDPELVYEMQLASMVLGS